MERGAVGTVTASWTYYGQPDNSTVIYGSKGIMRLYDDPDHSLLIKLADGSLIAGRSGPMDFRAPSGVIDSWIESIKAGESPRVRWKIGARCNEDCICGNKILRDRNKYRNTLKKLKDRHLIDAGLFLLLITYIEDITPEAFHSYPGNAHAPSL